jgi:hypothetical protein
MQNWFHLPVIPRLTSRASGLSSNGVGVADVESLVVEVVLAAIFGGFVGMLGGLLLSNTLRGLSFHSIRPYTGTRMILLGSLLGAVTLSLAACRDAS